MTDSFFGSMLFKDRYRIESRIGTGGMARVYRAFDTNLKRPVAIKILHDHLAADTTFKQRFIREARFVAGFNHPNIVQVYDFDVIEQNDNHVYFMVMPFIPGPTLKDVMEDLAANGEQLPHERVLEILHDLCDALSYAHARGMIHRDVKPANILFDEHNHAVLTDFGIARLAEGSSLTQEGVTTGTPAYMSPEQVNGASVDSRSDIYALGIILFEMLAGTVPYADESGISTMLKHVQAPVPILSDHLVDPHPALDIVIVRALAKNPGDRFASASDFYLALKAALENRSVPMPLEHPKPTDSAVVADGTTLILGTQPSASVPTRRRFPLPLPMLGIGAVLLIVVIALLGRALIPGAATDGESEVPSMTGSVPDYVNSDFEPDSATSALWPQSSTSTLTREITADGFYRFSNQRPGIAATSILETEGDFHDSLITMQGLLEADSQPASAYGVVFRYEDSDNYYVFAVDGSRRFSIWVREKGIWRELRGSDETWTLNEAIQPLGTINELSILIHEDHFVGSVNGTVVADVEDSTLPAGKAGIYLATPEDGSASALIDSYILETNLGAPSMTADH
ncbi:MAG: serine/threonine protein kinase [Anaerolineae bacterium]|nr:serine/threonine protein kinase [Anaerolineae bacterium]